MIVVEIIDHYHYYYYSDLLRYLFKFNFNLNKNVKINVKLLLQITYPSVRLNCLIHSFVVVDIQNIYFDPFLPLEFNDPVKMEIISNENNVNLN